jgi:hypothetical protein
VTALLDEGSLSVPCVFVGPVNKIWHSANARSRNLPDYTDILHLVLFGVANLGEEKLTILDYHVGVIEDPTANPLIVNIKAMNEAVIPNSLVQALRVVLACRYGSG